MRQTKCEGGVEWYEHMSTKKCVMCVRVVERNVYKECFSKYAYRGAERLLPGCPPAFASVLVNIIS